ncbi:DUF1178 family protein [Desulfogranum japonicum]|uniref:DUF1178 family protein n=1 Tax=Desulfogranum japonicum TaxID=231447 RepID=UPI000423AB03|nr:DUF1178 family protein [Desulfogranum japonicum]
MIVYDLECPCGYQFEGWFSSRAGFEEQLSQQLVLCPNCGGCQVHKILSPVAYHHKASSSSRPSQAQVPVKEDSGGQELVRYLESVSRFVEDNFEDVGANLATESLKMHYGVEEKRNIRGVATEQEEKMLEQEGIALLKVPYIKPDSEPGSESN